MSVIPFHRRDRIGWTVIVDEDYCDSVSVRRFDEGHVIISILTSDFSRLDRLRKEGLCLYKNGDGQRCEY